MALPTLAGTLQVTTPAFVRKLRRRSDWGDTSDADQAQRIRDAVDKLFCSQTKADISMYLVHNDKDLRRVALGMNAGCGSLNEAVPFVAFLPAELALAAIRANQTPGNLPCMHANCLHYDIKASETQLARLCETAMKSGRVAGNCSQGMMKDIFAEATKENCRTVTKEGACQVATCKPAE